MAGIKGRSGRKNYPEEEARKASVRQAWNIVQRHLKRGPDIKVALPIALKDLSNSATLPAQNLFISISGEMKDKYKLEPIQAKNLNDTNDINTSTSPDSQGQPPLPSGELREAVWEDNPGSGGDKGDGTLPPSEDSLHSPDVSPSQGHSLADVAQGNGASNCETQREPSGVRSTECILSGTPSA